MAARSDSIAGVLLERALDLGARDHQRRAQIVGDVVADVLQLLEQALDLVEHQIDRARHLVDVVAFAGDRQARMELAVHDADDRAVDALEALRGAAGEEGADRENEKDGRRERDRQRPQHRLLQVVDFAQAASEQDDSAVGAPAGDEERGLAAARVRQKLFGDDMGGPVDRDRRHGGHVAEQSCALRVEQGDIVEAADVAGQAQFQRPAQLVFAVAFAFRRLVDQHRARPLHVRRGKPEDK